MSAWAWKSLESPHWWIVQMYYQWVVISFASALHTHKHTERERERERERETDRERERERHWLPLRDHLDCQRMDASEKILEQSLLVSHCSSARATPPHATNRQNLSTPLYRWQWLMTPEEKMAFSHFPSSAHPPPPVYSKSSRRTQTGLDRSRDCHPFTPHLISRPLTSKADGIDWARQC